MSVQRHSQPFFHLPPTAVPLTRGDLLQAVQALRHPNGSQERFITALVQSTGTSHCFLTSSGRSALALILHTLKKRSKRARVILPAYTCPTVAQAVLSVGLQPVFCDVDPLSLDLDRQNLQALLDEDVLAIVPTHLYGLVHDIADLVNLGRDTGSYIIEDAAQAFGARVRGQMVGRSGDFGFFSLGRGKCVPTGQGGIIVTRADYAPQLVQTIDEHIPSKNQRDIASLVKFLAYGLATTPAGWWFIVRSPLNPAGDGMDVKSLPPIDYRAFSPTQAGIGASMLERMGEINAVRRRNARLLKLILASYPYITIPETPIDSEPVYLRFPIILDEKSRADQLFSALSKAGIGVSRSYTHTLPDLFSTPRAEAPKRFPGAERLAACLLTLPTHAYLNPDAFSSIQKIFASTD